MSACLGRERATLCLLSHSLGSSSSLMATVTAAWLLCFSRRGPSSVVALHHLAVGKLLARNLYAVPPHFCLATSDVYALLGQ